MHWRDFLADLHEGEGGVPQGPDGVAGRRLGHLIEGTQVPFETVVVDNHSKDGSADAVEKEFPGVHVHRMSRNAGFGRANNAGLELTKGRFVLVLNPDVMLEPGCVDELADFLLVRPDVGAAGPRLLRPDGQPDKAARRGSPTPGVAFYRFSGLSRREALKHIG